MRRREFLAGAAALAALPAVKAAEAPRLLILGGTGFLGRNLAEEALRRGYQLTLLHLHEDTSSLVQGATQILADRNKSLPSTLNGKNYDYVVDTSGQLPAWLEESTSRLKDCGRYLFISTISVYEHSREPISEESPLAPTADVQVDTIEPGNYAARKILCERAVQQKLGSRALIFRPCVIAGPYDKTDRFTYWADRVRRPGPILGPESPDETVQWIDARDLCIFALDALAAGREGVMNVAGDSTRFGTFFNLLGPDLQVTWVPSEFLEKAGVRPWQDLPLWVPSDSDNAGFSRVDNSKAREAGLRTRAGTQTGADTLAWRDQDKTPLRAGLPAQREEAVLSAFKAHRT
ncbi:MAG: NAD-dependent epimerase/dehydratase family protein [Candidatus Eremiobacteraeota bacterium]|nr:NAD-dependent epimerase/dehydratase family protein [Candidatus Eremiobacteraeota bacterium]MCW5868439.1 NAD-dependent epimerase/dehydratase family protein [Candidatus Eremiobacteraeota bacterium]